MPSIGHLEPSPAIQRSGRSVDTCKTWPNHLNLFWFSAYSKDWTLRPSSPRLTSGLFTKIFHHILPAMRRYRRSNTESLHKSVLNGHVSESYSSTNVTAAVYTRHSLGNQIPPRRHGCLKLVNANRALRKRQSTLPIYEYQVKYNYPCKQIYPPHPAVP